MVNFAYMFISRVFMSFTGEVDLDEQQVSLL